MVNSDCECPAGAGLHCTCKHVAALAFVLHQFVTLVLNTHRGETNSVGLDLVHVARDFVALNDYLREMFGHF